MNSVQHHFHRFRKELYQITLQIFSFQATYVTSLFPYLILAVLFVRGITLDGSLEGIIYYLKPEFHRLLSAQVVYGTLRVLYYLGMGHLSNGIKYHFFVKLRVTSYDELD